jgi:hypothetical protein
MIHNYKDVDQMQGEEVVLEEGSEDGAEEVGDNLGEILFLGDKEVEELKQVVQLVVEPNDFMKELGLAE